MDKTLGCHPGGSGSNPGWNISFFCLKMKWKCLSIWNRWNIMSDQKNYYTKQINIVLYFSDFKKKQWNIMSNHENIGPKLVK